MPHTRDTRSEERKVTCGHCRIHFLERRQVIEDPDRSAVSAQNKIVLTRLQFDVVDGNGRKIILERDPVRTMIPGNPETKFCSRKKQVSVARMFAYHVNRTGRVGNAVADRPPGFAIVGCRKNVDSVIVCPMAVKRDVCRAWRIF